MSLSGMLKACVLSHEKSFSSTFSKWIFFYLLLFVPLLLKLTTSVDVRCFVQPAVNCNVRTRSHQNAFQWALKARTLWAPYSWVTASLLCYSCAPHNETNDIYKKKNALSLHWTRAKLLLRLSWKGNPCQDLQLIVRRDRPRSTICVVGEACQLYEHICYANE